MIAAALFTMNDFDTSEARRIAEDLIGKYIFNAGSAPKPADSAGAAPSGSAAPSLSAPGTVPQGGQGAPAKP